MNTIIEGPDGAGKSVLVKRLQQVTGMRVATRQSDSVTGPVRNVYAVATSEVRRWAAGAPPQIYDRFGLISEPIYGPICRQYLSDQFQTDEFQVALMELLTTQRVIICLPPIQTVRNNVKCTPEWQMDGVVEHLDEIYHAYVEFYYRMKGHRSANLVKWDYTKEGSDKWIG